jgi:hypothetical protein
LEALSKEITCLEVERMHFPLLIKQVDELISAATVFQLAIQWAQRKAKVAREFDVGLMSKAM